MRQTACQNHRWHSDCWSDPKLLVAQTIYTGRKKKDVSECCTFLWENLLKIYSFLHADVSCSNTFTTDSIVRRTLASLFMITPLLCRKMQKAPWFPPHIHTQSIKTRCYTEIHIITGASARFQTCSRCFKFFLWSFLQIHLLIKRHH